MNIEQVKNGWIVTILNKHRGSYQEQFVFNNPEQLANFIKNYATGQQQSDKEKKCDC